MAIDYKNLIIETNTVETTNNEIKTKQAAAKKKPEVEYIIEGISGPDMVVTKKSTRKNEQFVMLTSQGQMYIKDMKTGIITIAEPENISTFFDKLESPLKCVDLEGHKLSWTDTFYRGMKFARVIHKLVNNEGLREYFNKGLFYQKLDDLTEDRLVNNSTLYQYKIISTIYDIIPDELKKPFLNYFSYRLICNYNYNKESYIYYEINDYDYFKLTTLLAAFQGNLEDNILYTTYGLDGVRRIISEYLATAVNTFPGTGCIERLFKGITNNYKVKAKPCNTSFEISSFIQYLFYSSVEQGYADQINNFLEIWNDTLNMQRTIYKHGIVDKYPETLASSHQILCYKYNLLKQKIDEKLWKEQSEKMSKYERHGEKYIIIAPKSPDDMVNEARQQSNCLSSYVRHVINGECMIFFLRTAKEPDKSLVTIEIRSDMSLGQVRAKYNKAPSQEETDYVEKWYKDKFLNKKGESNE